MFELFETELLTVACWCTRTVMSKLLRGLAAGWGAKKLGGGCISTILVFIVLWFVLGHFRIFQ